MMKIKTNVKASGLDTVNHSQTIARSLKVKTNLKAGGLDTLNHNQTMGASRKLLVKTHVKAGVACIARPSFAPSVQTVATDESSSFSYHRTTERSLKVKA